MGTFSKGGLYAIKTLVVLYNNNLKSILKLQSYLEKNLCFENMF